MYHRDELIRGSMFQSKYSDGLIMRSILQGEKAWWGAVGESKKKTMKRLLSNLTVLPALKKLVQYDGLWVEEAGWGNLSSVSSLSGHETEITKYIKAIAAFWGSLPEGSCDDTTAANLELLCPKVPVEKKRILTMFKNRLLFQRLPDGERYRALELVLDTKYALIPTIRSFVNNLKWIGELPVFKDC